MAQVLTWKYNKEALHLTTKLGEGSFGVVREGILIERYVQKLEKGQLKNVAEGRQIAVKVLKADYFDPKKRNEAIKELTNIVQLQHPNIVACYGYVDELIPWLIFEFMSGGSLATFVNKNAVTEKRLVEYCHDICKGMEYLHKRNVVHRDLAARNVLLNQNTAKVSDFGLSMVISAQSVAPFVAPSAKHVRTMATGVPVYHTAKECYTEQIYTFESDVWSFGVTMHEMWNGGLPAALPPNVTMQSYVVSGGSPLNIKQVRASSDMLTVMKMVLVPERKSRPTFTRLAAAFEHYRKKEYPGVIESGSAKLKRYAAAK